MEEVELLLKAREALKHAYAPYSEFRVGAALLTGDGRVFKGVNVENVSLGHTICAERSALTAAVSAGYRSFVMLAVASEGGKQLPLPCGACRQVLREFCQDLKIIVAGEGSRPSTFSLMELLPYSYGRVDAEQKPHQE